MVADNEFYVTASIGISIFPLDAEDGETMLDHAHTAMRKSKKTGPGGYVLFSKDADDPVRGLSFTTKLRKAVERKDWVLHYHPIVDLEAGTWSGSRRCCGGATRTASWSHRASSSWPPRTWALIEAVGDWVVDEIAGSRAPGARTGSSWTSASTCRRGSCGSRTWSSASARRCAPRASTPRRS